MLARMKQRNHPINDRIDRVCAFCFVLVAAQTREREIFRHRLALLVTWLDVINAERVGSVFCLTPAIFAAIPGAIRNQAAQLGRNVLLSHTQTIAVG